MTTTGLRDSGTVPVEWLSEFCKAALESRKVREDVVKHVVASLVGTSLRGVDSHGVELLPHYLRALDRGRINPQPHYHFHPTGAATGRLDADHAFGHAAGAEAMARAMALARDAGVGAVVVSESTHFGAAWYFSVLAAREDMLGLSFTHADSLMLSFGGVRPFFGTNPICFAAPCEGEEPLCLDMATSLVTWNKIRLKREAEAELPPGWALDDRGRPTTDASRASCLTPIGDYKGFGLAMMIEVLCSLMSGMPFGPDIPPMYTTPLEERRHLGHFFMAFNIAAFEQPGTFKRRLKEMIERVRAEPPRDPNVPVMVPGDPEKRTSAQRARAGIPLSARAITEIEAIASTISFPAPRTFR